MKPGPTHTSQPPHPQNVSEALEGATEASAESAWWRAGAFQRLLEGSREGSQGSEGVPPPEDDYDSAVGNHSDLVWKSAKLEEMLLGREEVQQEKDLISKAVSQTRLPPDLNIGELYQVTLWQLVKLLPDNFTWADLDELDWPNVVICFQLWNYAPHQPGDDCLHPLHGDENGKIAFSSPRNFARVFNRALAAGGQPGLRMQDVVSLADIMGRTLTLRLSDGKGYVYYFNSLLLRSPWTPPSLLVLLHLIGFLSAAGLDFWILGKTCSRVTT